MYTYLNTYTPIHTMAYIILVIVNTYTKLIKPLNYNQSVSREEDAIPSVFFSVIWDKAFYSGNV